MNKVEIKRFSNGTIHCEWSFLGDNRHGHQREWYQNGNIAAIFKMDNSRYDELYQFFRGDGTLKIVKQYKISMPLGLSIYFKYKN